MNRGNPVQNPVENHWVFPTPGSNVETLTVAPRRSTIFPPRSETLERHMLVGLGSPHPRFFHQSTTPTTTAVLVSIELQ